MVNYRASTRFQDALALLRECDQHMEDELESTEQIARKYLISLCKEIAYDNEDNE